MKYNVYLFDFDYTLADSSRGIVMCFRIVLQRHNHEGITDDAIKRTIGKSLEESFCILTGITDETVLLGYKAEYVREADKYMTANTVLFPDTVDALATLKERGAKLGIISTKFRYRIQETVDSHFSRGFFDIIIGGEDVKQTKPAAEGVVKAMEILGCGKSDVLYIGDSTVDALTAANAGVDFAGVLNGATGRCELEQFGHVAICRSLTEIADRFGKF